MSSPDRDRLRRTHELRARLAELSVTERSPDRLVTVVARPGGVQSITIAQEARERTPDRLGRTVLATIKAAVARADDECAAMIRSTMGGNRGVQDILRGRLPTVTDDSRRSR